MKYWVLGLGRSGQAAMKWLEGEDVQGIDDQSAPFDGEPAPHDTVVVSPGVPPSHPFYRAALNKGCQVIAEAELALRGRKGRAIGITGTNGKTTVTLMTTELLNRAGVEAVAVGNVGEPLCNYAKDPRVLVVELSSYQLEQMHTPVFERGMILNITPDHLDRYPSFAAYAEAKMRLITLCQGPCFLGREVKGGGDRVDLSKTQELAAEFPHLPLHDIENGLCAWQLAKPYGASFDHVRQMLQAFEKPEHRLEFLGQLKGVCYYNDSKATNVAATSSALRSLKRPIHLIAGGVHKGSSYQEWGSGQIKGLYLIGEAAKQIEQDLGDQLTCVQCGTLERAVEAARQVAQEGDVVLFSPGCSSFDQFKNYEVRGLSFKNTIVPLMERS